MNHRPRLIASGITVVLALGFFALPAAGASSRSPVPGVPAFPQSAAAQGAAQWLAGLLTPGGWIPNADSTPNASYTANTVLVLVAAKVDPAGVQSALAYLKANVDGYVAQYGADGPGQLALLILDAEAGGTDPTDFGGTDLVARLLATEQPSGLFGTDDQLVNYAAGNYEQGLALQALGVAGVRGANLATAVTYLVDQQCPDGGWSFTDQATDGCVVSAADFTGPDTNSTAEAVEGLAAQGAVTPAISAGALGFYATGQDADGGWSYYPNSSAAPQTTDPDSTAFAIQALVGLGRSPTGAAFANGSANPVTALLGFQLTSGPGAGAFASLYAPGAPNLTASFQAAPAMAGASFAFPLGTSNASYWLAGPDGSVVPTGGAPNHGSLPALGVTVHDVVGLAATPDGGGYWEVAADGGVFAFGDAAYQGSMGGQPLNRPIVGLAPTSDGAGYWEAAADGGVFAFGDAGFDGSMGGRALASPIVGLAATPDGGGYWEVAADGGVFAFGDAAYQGSLPGLGVAERGVVGLVPAPAGGGYWEVAADGGVFAFGTASFGGSVGGQPLNRPVVGLAATPDGGGYWEAAADGGVFAFGDAGFAGTSSGSPVVGVAPSSARAT